MNNQKIIDFHAHILPLADHGSDSLQTSLKQLDLLSTVGVEKVVATPHFYPQRDSVQSFLKRRAKSAEPLMSEKRVGHPDICLGAEILVCPGIDHLPGLEKLCIEGTNVLLLEMPYASWREEEIEAVVKTVRQGFTVVMAHIDRYPKADILRLFSECTPLCQLNSETVGSVRGKKKALWALENLEIAAIGSDIHGSCKKSAKRLSALSSLLCKKDVCVYEKTLSLLKGADLN